MIRSDLNGHVGEGNSEVMNRFGVREKEPGRTDGRFYQEDGNVCSQHLFLKGGTQGDL